MTPIYEIDTNKIITTGDIIKLLGALEICMSQEHALKHGIQEFLQQDPVPQELDIDEIEEPDDTKAGSGS